MVTKVILVVCLRTWRKWIPWSACSKTLLPSTVRSVGANRDIWGLTVCYNLCKLLSSTWLHGCRRSTHCHLCRRWSIALVVRGWSGVLVPDNFVLLYVRYLQHDRLVWWEIIQRVEVACLFVCRIPFPAVTHIVTVYLFI